MEAARILCRRRFGAVFEDLVRQGVRRGEFPVQRVDVTAACIVGAFTEALVRPIASKGAANLPSDRTLVRWIADFCLRAVGGPAPAVRRTRS